MAVPAVLPQRVEFPKLPEPEPTPLVLEEPEVLIQDSWTYCSCIKTARALGVNLPRGNAKDLQPNSEPAVGGVIIFNYDGVHHVAVIKSIDEGFLVQEGNFKKCQFTERVIPFDSPNIVGYWSE